MSALRGEIKQGEGNMSFAANNNTAPNALGLSLDDDAFEKRVLLDIEPAVISAYEPKFDKNLWPRIVVRSRDKAFTDSEMEQVLAVFLSQILFGKPFVNIFDFRLYRYPSMYQVYRCMTWCRSRKEEFDKYLRCSCVILNNNYWSTPGWSIVELCKLCNVSDQPMLVAHDMPTVLEFIESVYQESRRSGKPGMLQREMSMSAESYITMNEFFDVEEIGDDDPNKLVNDKHPSTVTGSTRSHSVYSRKELSEDFSKNKKVKETIEWETLLDIPAAIGRFGGNKPRELPTFHVVVREEGIRSEDVELIQNALLSLLAKKTPFKAKYDVREFKVPAMSYVYTLANFVTENGEAYEKYLKCSVVILGKNFWSSAIRKMVDLLLVLSPPPCPVLICHTDAAAEAFFEEKLEAIQMPAEDGQAAEENGPNERQSDASSINNEEKMQPQLNRCGSYLQDRSSGLGRNSRFISLYSFKSFDEIGDFDVDDSYSRNSSKGISFKDLQGDLASHGKPAGSEEDNSLAKKTFFSLPELWSIKIVAPPSEEILDDAPARPQPRTTIAGFSIMDCRFKSEASCGWPSAVKNDDAAGAGSEVGEVGGAPYGESEATRGQCVIA